jgi:diguanylate cyclase (GGDEF)-like protein
MFEAAHKSLPPIDYVSMIRSLYADRRVMMLGALSSALVATVAGIESGSITLLVLGAAFAIVGIARNLDMRAFQQKGIADDDVGRAMRWEMRATVGAAAIAALYGFWVFFSFVFVNTPYAELSSLAVTVSVLVGVAGRNFAIDRLVSIQVLLISAPMAAGMLLDGDWHMAMLSIVLIAFFVSLRKVAANVRGILLKAVHGRIEATRLASELDTALETMQHGLCMLDGQGVITVANDRARLVFASFLPDNWEGRPFAALMEAAAERGTIPPRAAQRLMETVREGGGGKVVLRLPEGQHCEVTVSSRQDRTVLLFEDITERVKAEERINFMAHYDALTGLPNRGYFSEQVEADLERRRHGRPGNIAMLMIVDVDDFKHVNDSMGHLIGDRVLVETSERLSGVLGRDSLIARLGGDEYVIYRSAGPGGLDPRADANAILAAFQAPFAVSGEVFHVAVSIGVVTSTNPEDDLDALMTKADLALYKAKGNGKSRFDVFHDEMDTDYRYRQRLKAELKTAVAEGKLNLVFQPIVDIRSRKVVSCEALARWQHPELGSIPPSLFIPIAEETGLISEISRWVLANATRECQNWPEEVSVSVNISARDFRNADVVEMVESALRGSRLAPHRLEIEVTETALIEEKEVATFILERIAEQGIGIALDDFGTGYSSLSYLHALPFTKLKIDRSFVLDIGDNPRSLRLLSNVAQLGKDINLTVTVEGVETEEQLALIAQHSRVDQIQGYLFGRPLPRRDVAELIERMRGASDVTVPLALTANRKRG